MPSLKPACELVIIGIGNEQSVNEVLKREFNLLSDNSIDLSNRYFSKQVTAAVYSEVEHVDQIQDSQLQRLIAEVPAHAVVVSASNDTAVARGKRAWEEVHGHCSESAVSILFIDNDSLSEAETSDLVRWGLLHNVQIITKSVCDDDDISVSACIRQALECAQWHGTSPAHLQRTTNDAEQHSCRSNHHELPSHPKVEISAPTRLRRGLGEDDVAQLVEDLALLDDSDESG